jgi:hypothetical protein
VTEETQNPLDFPSPDLTGWEGDTLSEQEQKNWSRYDEISQAKHKNRLLIHKTVGILVPAALVVAFVGFLAMAGVYVAHILLPDNRHWLTDLELQRIHDLIFSSVVGGAIAIVARTYFFDEPPNGPKPPKF